MIPREGRELVERGREVIGEASFFKADIEAYIMQRNNPSIVFQGSILYIGINTRNK